MSDRPRIYVLAGVNGGGKSSIGGAAFRDSGAQYYKPDETARELMAARPGLTLAEANAEAWRIGRVLLERAFQERLDFSFEASSFPSFRPCESNSHPAEPEAGGLPEPRLVLHMEEGHIIGPEDLSQTPAWAKPIVAATLRRNLGGL